MNHLIIQYRMLYISIVISLSKMACYNLVKFIGKIKYEWYSKEYLIISYKSSEIISARGEILNFKTYH